MNNIYLKKVPQQGFATTQSSLQQFVQHVYQMQHTSIFFCQSGEALFTIDGHKYRFTPGQRGIQEEDMPYSFTKELANQK